jgi:xanthine dehydrogenase accessory factor
VLRSVSDLLFDAKQTVPHRRRRCGGERRILRDRTPGARLPITLDKLMREIRDIVRLFEVRRGSPLALATLVRARGSSYRRPGARMLIAPEGECAGSLSGGCLEEEVAQRACTVMRTGIPTVLAFDTRRRFGCHGAIEIFVERIVDSFLAGLQHHFHTRRSCIVATIFESGSNHRGSRLIQSTNDLAKGALVQTIDPPIQLIIVGDGPDSATLRAFAHVLGWSVIEAADASELAGPFDEWTAAVVKTHHFGRDFAALRALAPHRLRYIGLLGPRKRRDQLIGDLFDTGLDAVMNLFAPAGLDLGAESPEQIALSIISEIQAVFAGGSRQSLRERKTPVHGHGLESPGEFAARSTMR